jgi:hypothetical protein
MGSGLYDLGSEISDRKSGIRDLGSRMWGQRSGLLNLGYFVWHRSRIWELEFGVWDSVTGL